jgi:hypothetical protein
MCNRAKTELSSEKPTPFYKSVNQKRFRTTDLYRPGTVHQMPVKEFFIKK